MDPIKSVKLVFQPQVADEYLLSGSAFLIVFKRGSCPLMLKLRL